MTLKDKPAFIIKNAGRAVDYFGITLYVPKKYKWLATDKDGTVWMFKHKPTWSHNVGWTTDSCEYVQSAQVMEVEGAPYSRVKVKRLEQIIADPKPVLTQART